MVLRNRDWRDRLSDDLPILLIDSSYFYSMKMLRKTGLVLSLMLLVLFVLAPGEGWAQCAMCKVSAESSDSKLIAGLNSGILYLMGIPYILLVGVGVVLFRRAKAKP